MSDERVKDLTLDELRTLIRSTVRELLDESIERPPRGRPSDIPSLDVGPWPEGLELIRREDFYEDDGH